MEDKTHRTKNTRPHQNSFHEIAVINQASRASAPACKFCIGPLFARPGPAHCPGRMDGDRTANSVGFSPSHLLCLRLATFRSFRDWGVRWLTHKPLIHKHLSPWGHVAEWLRNGLQNRVHQFNSGRGLHPLVLDLFTVSWARFGSRVAVAVAAIGRRSG
jgi:hypothetical protein